MKILAFAASNSKASINRQLVVAATNVLRDDVLPAAQIEVLDLNDYEMALYSIDRQNADGIPAAAHRFYEKIGACDALIVSYAEHNGSYTAAFKNLFDWTSRIDAKVFQGKRMVAMSASPGARGGATVLAAAVTSAPFFGAQLMASFPVGRFFDVFDAQSGRLTDPALLKTLHESMAALVAS